MASLLQSPATNGRRSSDDTDNDESEAAVSVEGGVGAHSTSLKAQNPTLFHKVKNEQSILALLISQSKIYAGTQSGDLLVCCICSSMMICKS